MTIRPPTAHVSASSEAVTIGDRVDRALASGQIVEEAAYVGQYTEPAIQLLEYDGHPGVYGIRFCYFNLDGRFQRSPMMIDGENTLEGLREAINETPRLRELLRKLVG